MPPQPPRLIGLNVLLVLTLAACARAQSRRALLLRTWGWSDQPGGASRATVTYGTSLRIRAQRGQPGELDRNVLPVSMAPGTMPYSGWTAIGAEEECLANRTWRPAPFITQQSGHGAREKEIERDGKK